MEDATKLVTLVPKDTLADKEEVDPKKKRKVIMLLCIVNSYKLRYGETQK